MNDEKRRIYLDHAATTNLRPEVFSEIIKTFEEFGNPSSIYREGQRAKMLLENSRRRIAAVLHAEPGEIYFTGSGTESDNWAIKGTALYHAGKGKHIITSSIEHPAVMNACKSLEKQGFLITYLPVDAYGLIASETLESAIQKDTILVSIMLANNEIGTILPVQEFSEICEKRNILFHTDAVQAAGSIPVYADELRVNMLSLSGHKLYAPKGIGVLYIRQGTGIENILDGGAQERGKRAGTENLSYIAGLAAAFELSEAEMGEMTAQMIIWRDMMITKIENKIPDCCLNGHRKKRLPGNINFSFKGIQGESLLLLLDQAGFACSSGSACSSGAIEPSHVLTAIGLTKEMANAALRISLGKMNREEDIHEFIPVLTEKVKKLREMRSFYSEQI